MKDLKTKMPNPGTGIDAILHYGNRWPPPKRGTASNNARRPAFTSDGSCAMEPWSSMWFGFSRREITSSSPSISHRTMGVIRSSLRTGAPPQPSAIHGRDRVLGTRLSGKVESENGEVGFPGNGTFLSVGFESGMEECERSNLVQRPGGSCKAFLQQAYRIKTCFRPHDVGIHSHHFGFIKPSVQIKRIAATVAKVKHGSCVLWDLIVRSAIEWEHW